MKESQSILVRSSDMAEPVPDPSAGERIPGDLNAELLDTSWWSDDMLARAGIPVVDTPFVTVGGGFGSFVLVDLLRISGAPTSNITVLSNIDDPWQTYEYLTRVSQIPRPERLRSDSTGMPNCIWAFPSYAFHEARKEKTLAPLWNVLTEPIFTDYWTPRAGTAFTTTAKEAERIKWRSMVRKGQVRMVRRRVGGGYFTVTTPPAGTTATKRVAFRSRFVHVGVGYPGLRFLPDLQEYRQRHNDYTHVVNAYEPHEQVYEEMKRRPCTVLVRGGGIVASRVLQRLMEDRWNHRAQTTVLHLFRTYIDGYNGPGGLTGRRRGGGGFAYQGFNWPKGAWGGVLKFEIERAEGEARANIYKRLGGTHTPRRKLWQQQKARAAREGWYHTLVGTVEYMQPGAGGRGVVNTIKAKNGQLVDVYADFVIDATGLEADLKEHRLLADLLDHGGAGRNPMGRLDCERTFEIRGTRSEPGRMYASGAPTLGAYYAGVDSFLGLQYAALQITDDLAAQGFVKRLGPGRSLSGWLKWVRNQPLP